MCTYSVVLAILLTSLETAGPTPLARKLNISELDDIVRPESRPTTAELGRRTRPTREELPGNLTVETRCGRNWCVDGLISNNTVLIAPELQPDEAKALRDPGAWLERVIRVAWQDDAHVSAYVAVSEFSGGAHANNQLSCRSFARKPGRALSLKQVFQPRFAELLLSGTPRLFDDTVSLEELGEPLDAAGFQVDPQGFRFGRAGRLKGTRPEVILCAQGPYPSDSGTILELSVEALPVGYLLR